MIVRLSLVMCYSLSYIYLGFGFRRDIQSNFYFTWEPRFLSYVQNSFISLIHQNFSSFDYHFLQFLFKELFTNLSLNLVYMISTVDSLTSASCLSFDELSVYIILCLQMQILLIFCAESSFYLRLIVDIMLFYMTDAFEASGISFSSFWWICVIMCRNSFSCLYKILIHILFLPLAL